MPTKDKPELGTSHARDRAVDALVVPGRVGEAGIPRDDHEFVRAWECAPARKLGSENKSFRALVSDNTAHYGGAFELALTLVKHANKIEPRAAVLVSSQPPELLKARVADAFPARHFSAKEWKPPVGPRFTLPWTVARDFFRRVLPATYGFARLIRDYGATIVHLNSGVSPQLYGLLACRLMGAPCVVSFRGYEYPSRLIRPLRSLVDRYIVCSKPVKSHIVNVLGIPEAKIAYIYDPVDTDIFSPEVPPADLERLFGVPRGRKVFAIFGRLVPWKGHAVFLKAARLVLEAVPEAHAMIVGDTADGEPAYGDELRELSRELGIADRTTFTGYRSDIAPLMRASEVLVHASTEAEPFGTVVLEGMACGQPYVAMDEGGPPEMIGSGTHGLLVRPDQPEAMARAIITLLTQPETAAAFGLAARARCVERFSAPTIAKRHLELYREVADRKRALNAATSLTR